jgi:hypothetical protein
MKPFSGVRAGARPVNPRSQCQRGATLVEFAIVGPIAILLILGLIQIGMMMMAKQVLNEATFEAARMGATEHACKQDVMRALKRKLLPFYQDSTNPDDSSRLLQAGFAENLDLISIFPRLTAKRLSPPNSAFTDFGSSASGCDGNQMAAIPNDSLEYRTYSPGPQSGLTIQDANEFRIQVEYGYELKIPLMKLVFKSVMCGIDTGLNAFGRGSLAGIGNAGNCIKYYMQGRVPIVSYATVQMQSDVYQDPAWN